MVGACISQPLLNLIFDSLLIKKIESNKSKKEIKDLLADHSRMALLNKLSLHPKIRLQACNLFYQ